MLDFTTLSVLVVTFTIVFLYNKARKSNGMPPGPWCIPFIGNLGCLLRDNKHFHVTVEKLTKTYGGIVGLQFMHQPIVVISDTSLQREAFIKMGSVFSSRPADVPVWKALVKGRGIVMTNGDRWRQGKRMMIRCMRDVGMGKSLLDDIIQKEAEFLVEEIASSSTEAMVLKQPFQMAAVNIVYYLLLGKRKEYNDQRFIDLMRLIEQRFINGGYQNVFQFLPVYFLPLAPIVRPETLRGYSLDGQIRKMLHEEIGLCRTEYKSHEAKSFVDVFKENAKPSKDQQYFSEDNLIQIMTETFIAGSDTTASTLSWAVVFLCKNPGVQERCRKDIQNLARSTTGQVAYKDRVKLPYIEATICEIQRLANVVALAVPHYTQEEVQFAGYRIPKRTFVILNSYHSHLSPKYWDKPTNFNPDRFLNAEGKLEKPEAFMPFGIGPRACPGEELAKTELFMFLTSLLRRFRFEALSGYTLPDVDTAIYGTTLGTGEFKVRVTPLV